MKWREWKRTFAHLNIAIECFLFYFLLLSKARKSAKKRQKKKYKCLFSFIHANLPFRPLDGFVRTMILFLCLCWSKKKFEISVPIFWHSRVCINFIYWSMKWLENFSNFFIDWFFDQIHLMEILLFFFFALFMRDGWQTIAMLNEIKRKPYKCTHTHTYIYIYMKYIINAGWQPK